MSPLCRADRTLVSGTSLPRSTRSSNGLLASSDGDWGAASFDMTLGSVERAVDHIHLLFSGKADKVHRIPRHPDREIRILLRVVHRIQQSLAIEHVDVHVIA